MTTGAFFSAYVFSITLGVSFVGLALALGGSTLSTFSITLDVSLTTSTGLSTFVFLGSSLTTFSLTTGAFSATLALGVKVTYGVSFTITGITFCFSITLGASLTTVVGTVTLSTTVAFFGSSITTFSMGATFAITLAVSLLLVSCVGGFGVSFGFS
jgi:hypothetical protein